MTSILIQRSLVVGAVVLGVCALDASAQKDEDRTKYQGVAVAPANTRQFGSAPGGAYYVDAKLYDRYRKLQSEVARVRAELTRGATDGETALRALNRIEKESKELRKQLEDSKVLVAAFKVFKKTTTTQFELGPEQLIIITGDDVTVRGWDGPGIKCVLEKTILAKEKPDAKLFDEFKVEHEHIIASKMVGLTRAERDASEKKFLESEAGRKLTPEQRANRKKFVDKIHHDYDAYVDFQGKKANTLQLKGLRGQEGNRNLSIRINTAKGQAGSYSSQWQRRAKLTVFVPKCKMLAVRGCMAGLDIQGIECDLLLTTQGSLTRKYNGSFEVRGVKGDVVIDQAPVRVLTVVTGSVTISATNEFVNSGTSHSGGMRTFSPYATHTTRIANVGGSLTGEFLRTNLEVKRIRGQIDVKNHHGATSITLAEPDDKRTHRVLTSSGAINITGPKSALEQTPIYAFTECGQLSTNIDRKAWDSISFSAGRPNRGWHGFVPPSKDRFGFGRYERPDQAITNAKRAAGLDLISHAGRISVMFDTGEE